MHICYVANSRFPSERAHMTQIVSMCNAFSMLGHRVTLFVTNRRTDISALPEAHFGVPFLFKVKRVAVFDGAGISHHIPRFLQRWAFFAQRITFTVNTLLHPSLASADVVYGRDEWILWMLSLFTEKRLVWESHEAHYGFAAKRLLRKRIPVVTISEGIRDFYRERGVPTSQLFVAHDGMDERFFKKRLSSTLAREMLDIPICGNVVMYIGGLDTWKGIITFCESGKNVTDFSLYVVGGKEHEIRDLKERFPWVIFLGARDYKELPEVQQAADILVIPNTARIPLSALYTSPLKLFSYMASCVPIVASRIPSITTVLSEREAYFFTPDDPVSLRDTVRTALSDIVAKDKAKRAYQKSKEYTWEKRAESILAFLSRP